MHEFLKSYNDWVNLASTMVGDDIAQDIVQEAYIKLHSYNNDNINRSYIYLTIKSLCIDYLREKNKIHKEDVIEQIAYDEMDTEKEKAYSIILKKISKEIDTWHWYDALLFDIYRNNKKSLRDLSKETGISLTSIHYTIKNCKLKIQEVLKKDLENYNKQNYELIKTKER